ncbi:hypothetical protein PGT21_004310 [Puccinia graminis f. sp. tritici]|uniref:Uncharacterized protein n=1 Tax=Puccinia graminis f. sp. tritici TaxID=56615 RepID=A0A5B0PKE8_PUCGR|nr:hypothetical protein PGT21_004310 [Puccinia graminis f. sp. tritici]
MIDPRAFEEVKSQLALFLCRPHPAILALQSTASRPHLIIVKTLHGVARQKRNMKLFLFLLGLLLSREAAAAPAPVRALVSRQESGENGTLPPGGCQGPICA